MAMDGEQADIFGTGAGEQLRNQAWRTVVSLSCGLAGVLVTAKLLLLPFPVSTPAEFLRWVLRLGIVASADLLFVALLATVCGAVSAAACRGPSSARIWRGFMIGIYQTAGLYAVFSVPMFRLTMVPLTVQLLSFSGGPLLMGSSILEALTPEIVAALVAVPAALVASGACPGIGWIAKLRPKLAVIGLFTIIAYAGVCRAYIYSHWSDPNRWERRISASPHSAFLLSCAGGLLSAGRPGPDFDPSEVDTSDFTNLDNRPTRASLSSHVRWPVLPAATRPQNVIVVVLESVGVEYLGLYGAPYATTPHLERLVERGGIVFDNVYAHAPSSPKGLIALSAAVYPRLDWKLITRDSPSFDVPTLAQALGRMGYRSCYLHSGYWSWKDRDRFLRERSAEILDADGIPQPKVFSWGISDRELFRAGLQWIDQAPQQPFHLLFWTIETHHPYVFSGRQHDFGVDDPELGRYLNAIRSIDETIAWLVAELQTRGLDRDTLIAITGDHGEAFGQHGQRVHSFGVYEENVHVPLVLLHPSLKELPRRDGRVAQQIDIPATVAGLLGCRRPASWQGRHLLDEGPSQRAYFYSLGNEVLIGLRDGDLKYHYHVSSGFEELFDLSIDPNEQHNLASQHADKCVLYRRKVTGLANYQRQFLAEHGSP